MCECVRVCVLACMRGLSGRTAIPYLLIEQIAVIFLKHVVVILILISTLFLGRFVAVLNRSFYGDGRTTVNIRVNINIALSRVTTDTTAETSWMSCRSH